MHECMHACICTFTYSTSYIIYHIPYTIHTYMCIYIYISIYTHRHTHRHTLIYIYMHIHRHTSIHTYRQRARQAGRQTYIYMHTDTALCLQSHSVPFTYTARLVGMDRRGPHNTSQDGRQTGLCDSRLRCGSVCLRWMGSCRPPKKIEKSNPTRNGD